MALILVSLVLAFVGGGFAEDLLGFVGLGEGVARVWNLARWPAAVADRDAGVLVHLLRDPGRPASVVSLDHAGRRRAVVLWLAASFGFSAVPVAVADVGAIYGAFAGAIVLVGWLWLTNVAMLFGAEFNAEIERQKELAEGVPARDTLNRPARGA